MTSNAHTQRPWEAVAKPSTSSAGGGRAATFQHCGPGPRSTKQTPSAQGHPPRYLPPGPSSHDRWHEV